MSWVDIIEGEWPADDLRRAFVMGAKWWEFHQSGATMWQSDQRLAEEKAEEFFPNGKPPNKACTGLAGMHSPLTESTPEVLSAGEQDTLPPANQ